MDIDELVTLARTVGAEAFAARFQHLFFVHEARETQVPDVKVPLAFHTEATPNSRTLVRGRLRVLPVVKAPNSPYLDRVSVGRARNCDVVLRDASVSKLHAHIRQEGGGWVVTDLGSHNGTKIGEVALKSQQPMGVRSGQMVTFGSVAVRVMDAATLFSALALG